MCFNAARGFVGGATLPSRFTLSEATRFNAARGFVGGATPQSRLPLLIAARRFNAARGFVGGATGEPDGIYAIRQGFQCRTRLCGWCNPKIQIQQKWRCLFQCRTRLCGWCNRIARSPCPPRGGKALLESLRKFERSDGKYVKYLFLFSCSLRRNPLRDQHLTRP